MGYLILTINPGSTSTKVSLFDGNRVLFNENVKHVADELSKYPNLMDQLPYRQDTIEKALEKATIHFDKLDAVVGRGGGLLPLEGGTYEVDETILEHSTTSKNGVVHPANLGPSLAKQFALKYGARAFVVNPPDVDEFQDIARVTGLKDVYRVSHLHALNLKETAIRHSINNNKKYNECNYIVCHIGGGISISAHREGKMIDGYDIVMGEGPMAPTRVGSLPVASVLQLLKTQEQMDIKKRLTRTGGFMSHFGTSDAKDVYDQKMKGDQYATIVWDAMIYQIAKCIGSMATSLKGQVDGILLGGGMVYNEDLVTQIEDYCSYIANVYAYPGEFEMEAMASGAIRVLDGHEELKVYSGKPIWDGFDF